MANANLYRQSPQPLRHFPPGRASTQIPKDEPVRRFTQANSDAITCGTAMDRLQMQGAFSMAWYVRHRGSQNYFWLMSNAAFTVSIGVLFNASGLRLNSPANGFDQTITSIGALNEGEWGIWGISRPAGATSTVRAHLYKNGAWTHGNFAGTSADNTTAMAIFGPAFAIIATINCDHAVNGIWNGQNLSDSQFAELTTNLRTSDWLNNSAGRPTALHQFNQTNPAASPQDLAGDSDFNPIVTVPTVVYDGPPWNYDLTEQFQPDLVTRPMVPA